MSNLPLLIIGDYYYSHNKMMEGKMVTGQGYGMDIGEHDKLCPAAIGHGLVTLFSLSVSIEDRLLWWRVVRSQTYYPEHILEVDRPTMGRLVTLLSSVPALFGPTDWRRGKVEV